ncbi:uncharacterized protein LOC115408167 [Salarias fasciatus]|uniref:uncharacterized protein LOC115408167 n=1 Tax=Salarias fasciatus TaxID=181472 RepID=UPI001176A9A7|nr:uncharacterized protein LOC115408167 [Salarias fasciatus]
MSSVQALKEFISERLTAAAAEIFTAFQQTVVQCEEEIRHQRRLLGIGKESPQRHTGAQKTSSSMEQDEHEAPHIKEEEDLVEVTVTDGERDNSHNSVRDLTTQRLTAAAVEIFAMVEQTIVQYEEEIERQRRLLEINWNPQIKLHRTELPQNRDCREEQLFKEETNYCLDLGEPEPALIQMEREEPGLLHFKEEPEEPEPQQIKEEPGFLQFEGQQSEELDEMGTSQEGEQLILKFESDSFKFPSIKNESYLREPEEVPDTEQFLSQDSEVHHVKNHIDSESAVNAELKTISMFHSDGVENLPESDKQDEYGKSVYGATCGETVTDEMKTVCELYGKSYNQQSAMAPVKRQAYEAEFKLKAISHAVQHGNRAAAREFNIHESMVRKWRKQEGDLRRVKKTKKSFRGNKARWPQLEDKMEQWVVEQRAKSRSVSTVSIRLKAAEFARDLNIENFRGGPSWCFRFMKRRNLSIRLRTTVSQELPKNYRQTVAVFRTYCTNKISEKKIRPEHITSMDEVPLSFDIPVKTVTSTGSIHERSSFTVVLGCQADGQKLPPMVIFQRKTLPKERFPAGVIVKANPKGWMDEEKMSEWLREVYVKRPDGFAPTSPSLLICDSMRAHLTEAVKMQVKKSNSELAVIPGGLTKELQPLDIGINRSFKVKLRAAWERWMTEGRHTLIKTGRQRRPSYSIVCQWIVDSWAQVSASCVVRAFTKAGIIAPRTGDGNETDSDDEERDPGMLDAGIAQLFNSDTEDEGFDGFVGCD